MDKKLSGVSQTMSRFRGWIQAGATLLTNLHLPNFLKGGLYQGAGKTVCVPGLNCYSCPAASGACPIGAFQAVVGSSKFSFSYYTECIRCGMCIRACPTNAVCFRYGFGDGKEKENAATLRENNNKA